ncbi:NGG1p interacting factor NIF3 [Chlamydiota bacterium]
MKLKDLYTKAIDFGKKNDPRGIDGVQRMLHNNKRKYDRLSDAQKKEFDEESLTNPYLDSRIVWGDENSDVSGVMVGIDIGVSELLLADRLREKGVTIDCVISHHPIGKALASLYTVMGMQADILYGYGVPINVAESFTDERSKEVERKLLPSNFMRVRDGARLLAIPLVCLHTPCDNHVVTFLKILFEKEKPYLVEDVLKVIHSIPEYQAGITENFPPKVVVGDLSRRAGKIYVDMTGGTEGSKKLIKNMVQAGINTVVGMHFSEEHIKEAEAEKLTVIIAGHIPSDNVGLNCLLDNIFKEETFSVVECSGFFRVKRNVS